MKATRRPAEIDVRLAGDRFETVQPGIVTRHAFSSGSHYDPDNTGFGALIAVDEHVVEPGAGFAEHAHRGVEIVSWVLDGVLGHQDASGRSEQVGPGAVLHQSAGRGIRHTETNASATETLRFVQLTLLGGTGEPRCALREPPFLVPGAGVFAVLTGQTEIEARSAYLHVTRGGFNITNQPLAPGDSVRTTRSLTVSGTGELLAWVFPAAAVAPEPASEPPTGPLAALRARLRRR